MTIARGPVVLFGGSGFVGRHLRRLLADAATPVTLVSRRDPKPLAGEIVVTGDLARPATFVDVLPRGAVVVNLAYDAEGGRDGNLALADGLAEICRAAGASRLVHVSTAMVVGVVDERLVSERTVCHPQTPYQRTKLDVEVRLAARIDGACPVVVLRPTAVFGDGGRNLRKLATELTTRPAIENYLRACLFGSRPMNLVPVQTVAAAVAFAATTDLHGAITTWLVADDEEASNNFRDVERQMRVGLGLPTRSWPVPAVPPGVLAAVLRAAGRLSFDPRTRFSSRAIEAAGFVRPVGFRAALDAYARASRAGESGG